MKKYVITIVIIIGILLALFGSYYIYSTNNNSQNSIKTLKTKVDSEIKYLDNTIVSLMNRLNNISYANYKITEEEVKAEEQDSQGTSSDEQSSGGEEEKGPSKNSSNTITNMNMEYNSILVNTNKKINWEDIKKETEKMYHTWTTVLIDLNSLNVKQDNLLKYTSVLDNLTKAVEKEDKKASLIQLANLYSLIATYTREYSDDNEKINLFDTKLNILNAYVLIEDEKWNDIRISINKAQNSYQNIMNNKFKNNELISNINQAYVLLNEIENKDKNIFYINYKNLMQELEIIEK